MKKNSKDVALIARPDHSLFIYERLKGSSLDFIYITFKLIPSWMGRIFKGRKDKIVDRNYSLSWLMTLHNIAVYTYEIGFARKFSGGKIFSRHIKKILPKNSPRLIHYWPDYCINLITEYKKCHPNVRTIADIYFPCRQYVIEETIQALNSYGLEENLSGIRNGIATYDHIMSLEKDFIVPSPLVAESYKKYYPSNNFHVVSYGIRKWDGYIKKERPENVHKFVYVGTISVEKGCDLLCEWFSLHPDYEIHIIGKPHYKEVEIFAKYKNISNIYFEGVIPKSEVPFKVREFDCGIHLSRFDAYSLAVAEMTSAGLPVVVSDHSGIFFDIEKNKLGEVVSLNFESIGAGINKVVSNYAWYIDNIDYFIKNDKYDYGEEIIKLYKKILNE